MSYGAGWFVLGGALAGSLVGATATYIYNARARKSQTALNLALEFSSEPMIKHVNLFERCCADVRNRTGAAPNRVQQIELAAINGSELADRQDAIYHVLRYLERVAAFIGAGQVDTAVYCKLMELPLRELLKNVDGLVQNETSRDWQLLLARVGPISRLITRT